jgi:ABC-type transport system involved in multi-copper enzyme maturation permease subunit/uncharacterized membrane protein SpoIIM required for sporulation
VSIGSIATVARREANEIFSDWRIVLPIGLLTLLLPLIMANAAVYAIDFVEDEQLASGLLPFSLVLVGFLPASFSIITALESFVGERERNTLESLLSMPLSDRDLYLSKLCSSLLMPLISSTIAMGIFTSILYLFYYERFASSIGPVHLVTLFLITGTLAVTMVASAVVISSHMSSIRAANLMSSLVLLPGALLVQAAAILIIIDRWDVLRWLILALAMLAFLFIRAGMAMFNREEILAREHQSISLGRLLGLFGRSARRSEQQASSTAQQAVAAGGQVAVPKQVSHIKAIVTIARREIFETLTDWRVLLPVCILTFVVPLVLVSGTDFAVTFVQDERLVARLVPFAILVVGFIPASFSLITALESFVGERERNTLESLLAMPVSDGALYASKFASSLAVPLLTSYSAMLLFAGTLSVVYPQLYYTYTTPVILLQLLLIIAVMTLAMVAGAVIISSHTSSIRAANLLASFVLVPITMITAIQFPLFIANRLDITWTMMAALAVVAVALAHTGRMTFNREEILSREHEQLSISRTLETFALCFREYQPAGTAFDSYQGRAFSVGRFYRHELPALLRELRLPLALALIAAVGGMLLGSYIYGNYNIRGADRFLSQVGEWQSPGVGLTLFVLANNLRVSLLSNLLSLFSLGIFAVLVPLVAFAQIGFASTALRAQGGSWLQLGPFSPLQFMLAYVVPHGIIELPAFLLSAALGIRIGVSVLTPPGAFTVGDNIIWTLANFFKVWLLVLAPLVLVGSLVEGFLTPHIVALLYSRG